MEDIFQTYLEATNDDLKGAAHTLKKMAPSPMNTKLEKETKSDAVKKKQQRSKKDVVKDPLPQQVLRNTFLLFVPFSIGGEGLRKMEPLSLICWISFITKYPLVVVVSSIPDLLYMPYIMHSCYMLVQTSIFVKKFTSRG